MKPCKSLALIAVVSSTKKISVVSSTIASVKTTPEIAVWVPAVLAALDINSLLLYCKNE